MVKHVEATGFALGEHYMKMGQDHMMPALCEWINESTKAITEYQKEDTKAYDECMKKAQEKFTPAVVSSAAARARRLVMS